VTALLRVSSRFFVGRSRRGRTWCATAPGAALRADGTAAAERLARRQAWLEGLRRTASAPPCRRSLHPVAGDPHRHRRPGRTPPPRWPKSIANQPRPRVRIRPLGICFDRSGCGRYAQTLCLGCAWARVRVFNRMASQIPATAICASSAWRRRSAVFDTPDRVGRRRSRLASLTAHRNRRSSAYDPAAGP
jgi:hypothetical protein